MCLSLGAAVHLSCRYHLAFLWTVLFEAFFQGEHGLLAQSDLKSQLLTRPDPSPRPRTPFERRYEGDEAHWTTIEIETPGPDARRPLVVDLDGTLIASDLLIETAFSELGRRPHSLLDM